MVPSPMLLLVDSTNSPLGTTKRDARLLYGNTVDKPNEFQVTAQAMWLLFVFEHHTHENRTPEAPLALHSSYSRTCSYSKMGCLMDRETAGSPKMDAHTLACLRLRRLIVVVIRPRCRYSVLLFCGGSRQTTSQH